MFQIIAQGFVEDITIDSANNKVTGYFKTSEYQSAKRIPGWKFEAYINTKGEKATGVGSFLNPGQKVTVLGELTDTHVLIIREKLMEGAPIGVIGDKAFEISSANNDSLRVKVSAKTAHKAPDAKYYTSHLVSFFLNGGLSSLLSKYIGTQRPDVNLGAVGVLESNEYQGKTYYGLYRPSVSLLPGGSKAENTTQTKTEDAVFNDLNPKDLNIEAFD